MLLRLGTYTGKVPSYKSLKAINPFPAMTGGFKPGESEAYKNIFYV